MSARRLPLLVLLLVLNGCAVLEDKLGQGLRDEPPPTADEALDAARELSRQGRWTDATALLSRAAVEYPDDERLAQAYVDLRARGDREVRVIRDEIMVGDAENQQAKLALLERLSNAESDDLIVMSRRLYWKESLAGEAGKLTDCAEFHVTDNPALARRCYELALQIPVTQALEQRLAKVKAQLEKDESAAAAQRRASAQKARQVQTKALLDEAREAIGGHRYRRALDILKQAAKLEPENPEVAELQRQALEMLSPQVDALVKLGDHLYLEERLEAAVGTWQAALTLNPEDEEIVARIERAKTVLKKLETLRSQQNGEGKVPSLEPSQETSQEASQEAGLGQSQGTSQGPSPEPSQPPGPEPSPAASDPPLATQPPP